MREILFRGKRIDNGEWIEGYYVHLTDGSENRYRIYTGYAETDFDCILSQYYEVDPGTVGQYTGKKQMCDGIAHMLFEGDIVTVNNSSKPYEIVWDDWKARFIGRNGIYVVNNLWGGEIYSITVIGNIHDNPELLGGGGDE